MNEDIYTDTSLPHSHGYSIFQPKTTAPRYLMPRTTVYHCVKITKSYRKNVAGILATSRSVNGALPAITNNSNKKDMKLRASHPCACASNQRHSLLCYDGHHHTHIPADLCLEPASMIINKTRTN